MTLPSHPTDAKDWVWTPRLLQLESALEKYLPGQARLISTVAQTIRRRVAIEDHRLPLGKLFVLGPNEDAKRLAIGLADFLYDEPDAVLTLNMAEYREKHKVLGLVGHNGGLVCPFFEGDLTGPVLRQPQMVIVLANADMAHVTAWALLLPMLTTGELVDGIGRKISFKEAVVILTTKVGYTHSNDLEWSVNALECKFSQELVRGVHTILKLE